MTGGPISGRQAFARQAWGETYARLVTAPTPLDADDIERLAIAAHLLGRDDESKQAWERAQLEHARRGDPAQAARCAFWLGFLLLLGGHEAQAAGWIARAERLAGAAGGSCAAAGFVLVPKFLEMEWGDEPDAARALADQIVDVAHACDDAELLAFGLLCQGEALIASGELKDGMTLLDEAMVAVTTGELSPMPAGIIYCAVIGACMDVLDLRRAAEWTEALRQWCDDQPDIVLYRGVCLVHRAQVLQARGEWPAAAAEAEQARRYLERSEHPAIGVAYYQLGELHRLRGEHAEAKESYRDASAHGFEPAPGFTLLRLAEGHVGIAVGAVERMLEESRTPRTRPLLLAAAVDVFLAARDVASARAAADELDQFADPSAPAHLRALADYATGSVLLAAEDSAGALTRLRGAAATWREIEMPFETALARVQIAVACRALGDDDAADLELDAASAVFARLGARPALAAVAKLPRSGPGRLPADLSRRECEVLRLVATGATNREVAAALGISEHTVARHLQNIFTKLGLSSRAAATAYACANRLA
jgi:DNA-binding CsgD family transcriptional regulator